MHDDETRAMLIEYMGKGFLENIISLMRQDLSALRFIPDMMGDDGLMVRLGATALVEELAKDHRQALTVAVPGLLALLQSENATIRGDAANALGIIGDRTAREALLSLQLDANAVVREIAEDALAELDRDKASADDGAQGQR